MRVLITGASGLLGNKIAEKLTKYCDVYSTYHNVDDVKGIKYKVDITSKKQIKEVISATEPDVIIHSAALTNVDMCENNKILAKNVNFLGTKNIIESCKNIRPFLLYISTDYVFSGDKGFYCEDDETGPVNYYGLTKMLAENEIIKSKLSSSIVRSSVIYGANPKRNNFAIWIINNLIKEKRINIVIDQIVSPTLNTNLADMIHEIVENRIEGIIHCSGKEPQSRLEFARKIAEKFELNENLINKATVEDLNWKAIRPRDSSLNVKKALKILRNKPLGVSESIDILKSEYYANFCDEK